MKKIAVFDVEATNWVNFACLGFFDGDEYKVYWGIEHFLEDVLSYKYRGFRFFAHFGGRYDFRFLVPPLISDGKYVLSFMERGSSIMSMTVRLRKLSWKFSDSYFLLPHSLGDLTKAFNVENRKKEFDLENEKDFSSAAAQDYLKNDCLGLYQVLEKFSMWGENNGTLKMTLPSQSLFVFSKNFLTKKLSNVQGDREDFVRKTYFGGRAEIFRMRGENLNYYDVNSLYPSCMMENMPVGKPMLVKKYIKDKPGFYRVKAYIPEGCSIPPLPVSVNNRLYFPVGEGEFFSTSAEIALLVEKDIKFEVMEGIVFREFFPIFRTYVQKIYAIRQASPRGSMDNMIAKLMLNSLYGKFGQRRENTEMIFSSVPQKGCTVFDESLGLYTKEVLSRSQFILPFLASYITSLARVRLYRLFTLSGFENIWYCDTDSVITSSSLPTGDGLGELKLEYRIKEAVFLQPKAYCLNLTHPIEKFDKKTGRLEYITQITRVKGMRDLKIDMSTFVKALENRDMGLINTRYFSLMGFRESIKRNKSVKLKRIEVHKKLNKFYDKRRVGNNLTYPLDYDFIHEQQGSLK